MLASLPGMAAKTAVYLGRSFHPRRPPLAYVGGWLGRANLGDEALFAATQRLFPAYSLWHYDGSRTLAALLDALPRTHAGLFAGGTLINRTPEYLDLARRFARRGRRLRFFGTGVADPAFWTGRGDFQNLLPLWAPFLNDCGTIGVRGPRSAELLADAGVADVAVVGDPVLAFADEQPPPPVRIRPRVLGLNLGFDHGHQWGRPADVQRHLLTLARLALTAGWHVKWFVVFPADLPLTRELARATGTETGIVRCYDDPRPFLREVSAVTLFAGMKLHATVLAVCASVPSLMFEYDPKCADFMCSIGQRHALMRTDRLDPHAAWEMLLDWSRDRPGRALALHRAVQDLRRRQLAHARQFAAAFSGCN